MQTNMPLVELLQKGLCCGCGACVAVCPEQIIDFEFNRKTGFYSARIEDKGRGCIECNRCVEVCPVHTMHRSGGKLLTSANLSEALNWLIGSYVQIYTGHATDEKVRYECSSGGVATALLKYLFEIGEVQGALVASHNSDNPIKHRISLVESTKEVVERRGTVYCQIDFSPAWEIIKENKGNLAVVGQPCHLRALGSFVSGEKLDASRILKIGLFCGGTTSHRALEYLCKRKGISPEDVLNIRYRSGGWPGRKMIVTVPDSENPGKTREVVLFDRDVSLLQRYLYRFCFSGPYFPKSCRMCRDQTAELADISLGDAWLSRFTSWDHVGTNMIVCRTARGAKVLQGAVARGLIELQEAHPGDVVESQGKCLVGRRLGLWGQHITGAEFGTSAAKAGHKLISQNVPSRGLLAERRFFQCLCERLPSSVAWELFCRYTVARDVGRRIRKVAARVVNGLIGT